MTTSTKITNQETLLAEKERLRSLCRISESRLSDRYEYIRENYVELSVDHVIIPVIKRAFNIQQLLNFFNLGSVASVITDRPVTKNKIADALQELFGKTGWLIAVRLGISMLKSFFKK